MTRYLFARQETLLLLAVCSVAALAQELDQDLYHALANEPNQELAQDLEQDPDQALVQELDQASLDQLFNQPGLAYSNTEDDDEPYKELYDFDPALEGLANSDQVEPQLSDSDETPTGGFEESAAAFQEDANADDQGQEENANKVPGENADQVLGEDADQVQGEDADQPYEDDWREYERTFQDGKSSEFSADDQQRSAAEKRRVCNRVYTGIDHYCNDPISRRAWKTYWWFRKVRSCSGFCKKAGKEGGECREGGGRYFLTTWCKDGEACACV